MTKKTLATSLPFLCLLLATPAPAQYLEHYQRTGKPAVEIYMNGLEDTAPPPRRAPEQIIKLRPPQEKQQPQLAPVQLRSPQQRQRQPQAIQQPMIPAAPVRRVLKPTMVPKRPTEAAVPVQTQAAPQITAKTVPETTPTAPVRKPVKIISNRPVQENVRDTLISQERTLTPSPAPAPKPAVQTSVPIEKPVQKPVLRAQQQKSAATQEQPIAAPAFKNFEQIPPVEPKQYKPAPRQASSVPEAPSIPAAHVRAPAAVPSIKDLTISFQGDSSDIASGASAKLDNIIVQMIENDDLRLRLHAYATGEDGTISSARRVSLARALAVRSYLMDQGVRPTRVDVRALGSDTDRTPLDRVDLIFAR